MAGPLAPFQIVLSWMDSRVTEQSSTTVEVHREHVVGFSCGLSERMREVDNMKKVRLSDTHGEKGSAAPAVFFNFLAKSLKIWQIQERLCPRLQPEDGASLLE